MKITSSISCPKCNSVTAVLTNTGQIEDPPQEIFCGICGEKHPSGIPWGVTGTPQDPDNHTDPEQPEGEGLEPGDYPLTNWPSRNSVISSMLQYIEHHIGRAMAESGEIKTGDFHEHVPQSLASTEAALALAPGLEKHLREILLTAGMSERSIDYLELWEDSIATKLERSLGPDESEAMEKLCREALLRWNSEENQPEDTEVHET